MSFLKFKSLVLFIKIVTKLLLLRPFESHIIISVCLATPIVHLYMILRVKHFAATVRFPGFPSGSLKSALQTAPNAPRPTTS